MAPWGRGGKSRTKAAPKEGGGAWLGPLPGGRSAAPASASLCHPPPAPPWPPAAPPPEVPSVFAPPRAGFGPASMTTSQRPSAAPAPSSPPVPPPAPPPVPPPAPSLPSRPAGGGASELLSLACPAPPSFGAEPKRATRKGTGLRTRTAADPARAAAEAEAEAAAAAIDAAVEADPVRGSRCGAWKGRERLAVNRSRRRSAKMAAAAEAAAEGEAGKGAPRFSAPAATKSSSEGLREGFDFGFAFEGTFSPGEASGKVPEPRASEAFVSA
mmetsp:Transcript_41820/g.94469  ORF Transcript_41820/g.94469 Transcript_41820/m.94469 type:complete len:270 (+) Transcript_41820:258-1067(+)